MNVQRLILAGALVTAIAWGVVGAQPEPHQHPPAHSDAAAEAARCAEAQPLVAKIIDSAMAKLEGARQSNSPTEMRAALDDMQAALRDLRAQLAPCAAMQPAGAHTGHQKPGRF